MRTRTGDPRHLAKELIKRSWLTPYQANQLLKGKIENLVFGPYLLLERLGEGGMGRVYKARHQRLGRLTALKIIRPECLSKRSAVARFLREAQAAAQLSHPNVVLVYDADQVGDTHYYAMEFVEGTDLARLVQDKGPLPIPLACDFIRQAALGLQHAHQQGLVHRDIKPGNLMVTGTGTVKVLDLGLVRMSPLTERPDAEAPRSSVTEAGVIVGTVDYMAPEQAKDAREVEARADLYALGCTLYHLLTGSAPFPEGRPWEKLLKHQLEEPTPLESRRPEVPAGLARIVRHLMAKTPKDRIQTGAELADALAPFCQDADITALRDAARASLLPCPPSLTPDARMQPTLQDGNIVAGPPRSAPRSAARPAVTVSLPGARRRRRLRLVIILGAVLGAVCLGVLSRHGEDKEAESGSLIWPAPPIGLDALNLMPPESTGYLVINPSRIPERYRNPLLDWQEKNIGPEFFDFTARTGLSLRDIDHAALALWVDVEQVSLKELPRKDAAQKQYTTVALKLKEPLSQDRKERILWALAADTRAYRLVPNRLAFHKSSGLARKGAEPAESMIVAFPKNDLVLVTSLPDNKLDSVPGFKDPPAGFSAGIKNLLAQAEHAFVLAFAALDGPNRVLTRGIVLDQKLVSNPKAVYDVLFRAQAGGLWATWEERFLELSLALRCQHDKDAALMAEELRPLLNLLQLFLPPQAPVGFRPIVGDLLRSAQLSAREQTALVTGRVPVKLADKLLRLP